MRRDLEREAAGLPPAAAQGGSANLSALFEQAASDAGIQPLPSSSTAPLQGSAAVRRWLQSSGSAAAMDAPARLSSANSGSRAATALPGVLPTLPAAAPSGTPREAAAGDASARPPAAGMPSPSRQSSAPMGHDARTVALEQLLSAIKGPQSGGSAASLPPAAASLPPHRVRGPSEQRELDATDTRRRPSLQREAAAPAEQGGSQVQEVAAQALQVDAPAPDGSPEPAPAAPQQLQQRPPSFLQRMLSAASGRSSMAGGPSAAASQPESLFVSRSSSVRTMVHMPAAAAGGGGSSDAVGPSYGTAMEAAQGVADEVAALRHGMLQEEPAAGIESSERPGAAPAAVAASSTEEDCLQGSLASPARSATSAGVTGPGLSSPVVAAAASASPAVSWPAPEQLASLPYSGLGSPAAAASASAGSAFSPGRAMDALLSEMEEVEASAADELAASPSAEQERGNAAAAVLPQAPLFPLRAAAPPAAAAMQQMQAAEEAAHRAHEQQQEAEVQPSTSSTGGSDGAQVPCSAAAVPAASQHSGLEEEEQEEEQQLSPLSQQPPPLQLPPPPPQQKPPQLPARLLGRLVSRAQHDSVGSVAGDKQQAAGPRSSRGEAGHGAAAAAGDASQQAALAAEGADLAQRMLEQAHAALQAEVAAKQAAAQAAEQAAAKAAAAAAALQAEGSQAEAAAAEASRAQAAMAAAQQSAAAAWQQLAQLESDVQATAGAAANALHASGSKAQAAKATAAALALRTACKWAAAARTGAAGSSAAAASEQDGAPLLLEAAEALLSRLEGASEPAGILYSPSAGKQVQPPAMQQVWRAQAMPERPAPSSSSAEAAASQQQAADADGGAAGSSVSTHGRAGEQPSTAAATLASSGAQTQAAGQSLPAVLEPAAVEPLQAAPAALEPPQAPPAAREASQEPPVASVPADLAERAILKMLGKHGRALAGAHQAGELGLAGGCVQRGEGERQHPPADGCHTSPAALPCRGRGGAAAGGRPHGCRPGGHRGCGQVALAVSGSSCLLMASLLLVCPAGH